MNWGSVICLCLALNCGVRAGDNWPAFRGSDGSGHADDRGLPTTWGESQNIVWKTPVHGSGYSSPVIWEDEIWLTTATDDGTELSFLVIETSTGKVLHDEMLFRVHTPEFKEKFNSYASPTPVLDEGRAYLSWGASGLVSIDRASREPLWVRRDLECNHYRGAGASPILHEGMLIQHYDGFDYQYVIALDKLTGETIWRTNRPFNFGTDNGDRKKAYATPIVIEAGGRTQLISPTSLGVFSYDPQTGEEIWRARFDQFSCAHRPLFDGKRIYFSSGFGKGVVHAIDPTGTGDVTDTHIVWTEAKTMPSKPSPLLIDGLLYLFNDKGIASCLEAATGEKVWQERLGGNYSASPVYADGKIFICSEDGATFVIKPGREYVQLAENTLEAGCLASPAIVDGALFLRTRTHLYRIDE